MAQLVEHCSANAEATGSNHVEAPKTFFNCLNCDSTAMVKFSFDPFCWFVSDHTNRSSTLMFNVHARFAGFRIREIRAKLGHLKNLKFRDISD